LEQQADSPPYESSPSLQHAIKAQGRSARDLFVDEYLPNDLPAPQAASSAVVARPSRRRLDQRTRQLESEGQPL